ncbi:unnamed protein product, partial [Polarella glacialis]
MAAARSTKAASQHKLMTCAQRIEAATTTKTQVTMPEIQALDAECLFQMFDFEGTALLSRGALTEVLRHVGLDKVMGAEFRAFAQLSFDSHSSDSHFLTHSEFKQLYYKLSQHYPLLLPRPTSLKITIMSGKGLPAADINGRSDPYCTVQVAGKPKSLSQTKHVDKTLDAWWGEEFTDKYGYNEGDNLQFEVRDYDRGSALGDLLCTATLPSREFHRAGGFDGVLQMALAPELGKIKGCTPLLKVRVSVNGLPEPPPALSILIRSSEGLPPADANGKSDPFCTVMIIGKPYSKSQTKIKNKTLEPNWNESFTDKYRYEDGDQIIFRVFDFDKGQDHDLLGEAVLDNSRFNVVGGFDGNLPLTCEQKGFKPTLNIK